MHNLLPYFSTFGAILIDIFNVIIQIRTILFCVFAGRNVTRKEANMFLYENPTMLELTRSLIDTQNARLTHSDDKEHILFI